MAPWRRPGTIPAVNPPPTPCQVLLVHDRAGDTSARALDPITQPITLGPVVEVTEVTTVLEALALYAATHFDIVVVGRPAATGSAADAVRRLREEAPQMVITVIVDPLDPRAVADALHAGATGVLSDGVSADDAASLVQIAARGTAVVDGRAAGSLASAWLPGSHDPLSARESEVLQRLASGATNAAIASRALPLPGDREVARGTAAPQDRRPRSRRGRRQGAPSRPARRRRSRRARRRLIRRCRSDAADQTLPITQGGSGTSRRRRGDRGCPTSSPRWRRGPRASGTPGGR